MDEYRGERFFQDVHHKLTESLGTPEQLHQVSPLAWCDSVLEVLLATILTQATSDRNSLKAWLNFKQTFSKPEEVLQRDEQILFATIRSAGMAVQKGTAIIGILQKIQETFGDFSLDILKKQPKAAWDFLTALPGVGPKTAACTMLFGLGLPCFPVDTHIERIAKRQGWVKPNANPAKIQDDLCESIPSPILADLHILLLNLGRSYCRPHNPRCLNCPILGSCQMNKHKKFT